MNILRGIGVSFKQIKNNMIQFKYTILYVDSVEKSMDFYAQVFGLNVKFITPEHDYGELSTGEVRLAFTSKELANQNLSRGFKSGKIGDLPFGIELGFTTDNVEQLIEAAISQGAQLVEKLQQKPWGQKVAYIQDLDGFLIEVCTPLD